MLIITIMNKIVALTVLGERKREGKEKEKVNRATSKKSCEIIIK